MKGDTRHSIVSELLTEFEGGSEDDLAAIRDLAASLFVGGADTVGHHSHTQLHILIFFFFAFPPIFLYTEPIRYLHVCSIHGQAPRYTGDCSGRFGSSCG